MVNGSDSIERKQHINLRYVNISRKFAVVGDRTGKTVGYIRGGDLAIASHLDQFYITSRAFFYFTGSKPPAAQCETSSLSGWDIHWESCPQAAESKYI